MLLTENRKEDITEGASRWCQDETLAGDRAGATPTQLASLRRNSRSSM